MSGLSMNLAWITVDDFKAAIKFYTEVVGLKLLECHDEYGWAELQGASGARLGIAKQNDIDQMKPGQNAIVTFTVEDFDKTKTEMVQKGAICVGDVLEIPGQAKMQMLRDRDGNQFQIYTKI
jgi:predicted enzyme related to lactoylglutathione lyase